MAVLHQPARDAGAHPAHPDDADLHQAAPAIWRLLVETAASRSSNAFANCATPSTTRVLVTPSRSSPRPCASARSCSASATPSVIVSPTVPWSRKASMVFGGMVLTVSAP